ncbi:MAG: adenylyltransferase/cytidyltransferase family protein, partial [bacterium]
MRVVRIVEDIKNLGVCSRPVVTVGTFDGLHLGHRAIIEEVIKRAKGLRGTSILVTFEPHPQAVVTPERAPFLLTTKEEKVRLLERTELDVILILTFTKVFSQMGARDFIRQILVGGIGLKEIIIGRNHAFGRQRQGRVSELEQMGPAFGFSVRSVSPVEVAGRRISSSWIREALTRGDVLQASKLLGRLYSLRGQVVPGTARGRMLRFPTANI